MQEPVKIPELTIFECPRCKRQAVAEVGSQMLCQPCVNEFLARNVGMMQPAEPVAEPVVPLEPVDSGDSFPPMPPGSGFEPGGQQ